MRADSVLPRMSISTAVPATAAWGSTYAIATGLPIVGAGAPLVTFPIARPPKRTRQPSRALRVPASTRPTRRGRPEAGLERIDVLGQLVAVEGHAGFEPQRVAGAESAGDRAAGDQFVRQRRHVGAADHDLDAVLARVAGVAEDAL